MKVNAKNLLKTIWLSLSTIRLIPHILFLQVHPRRQIIILDLDRWSNIRLGKQPGEAYSRVGAFVYLMTYYPEYRSLFYHRIGWAGRALHVFCKPLSSLYIYTQDIGPGLFIQHGFATGIGAKKIGRNCWINQQVTLGYSNDTECPTIGDNVFIHAGAIVIGNVKIGDNSVVGANSLVLQDIPENCSVLGVPATYLVPRKDRTSPIT
jgi:serine O-acetyltransferase